MKDIRAILLIGMAVVIAFLAGMMSQSHTHQAVLDSPTTPNTSNYTLPGKDSSGVVVIVNVNVNATGSNINVNNVNTPSGYGCNGACGRNTTSSITRSTSTTNTTSGITTTSIYNIVPNNTGGKAGTYTALVGIPVAGGGYYLYPVYNVSRIYIYYYNTTNIYGIHNYTYMVIFNNTNIVLNNTGGLYLLEFVLSNGSVVGITMPVVPLVIIISNNSTIYTISECGTNSTGMLGVPGSTGGKEHEHYHIIQNYGLNGTSTVVNINQNVNKTVQSHAGGG